jgi:hypothetical protein
LPDESAEFKAEIILARNREARFPSQHPRVNARPNSSGRREINGYDRIRVLQDGASGAFEIRLSAVENHKKDLRPHEGQNLVAFDDDATLVAKRAAQRGHGLGHSPPAHAQPERSLGPGGKIARAVPSAPCVTFLDEAETAPRR